MPEKMEHALKELAEPINLHINEPIAKKIVGVLKDSFITPINYVPFCDLLRAGFSSPRKTISNCLSNSLHKPKSECNSMLLNCGIDPQRRAETLELAEWEFLFDNSYEELFSLE